MIFQNPFRFQQETLDITKESRRTNNNVKKDTLQHMNDCDLRSLILAYLKK
jgi:hypothetical protein